MSVRVLEYVPEWREIIARLERLVAPGGRASSSPRRRSSVWRGTGRSRWFGPRNLLQRLLRRETDPASGSAISPCTS